VALMLVVVVVAGGATVGVELGKEEVGPPLVGQRLHPTALEVHLLSSQLLLPHPSLTLGTNLGLISLDSRLMIGLASGFLSRQMVDAWG
jgi:hypothetical protein